jgi:hypothetical protein
MAIHYVAPTSVSFSGTPRTASPQYIQSAIDGGDPGDTYVLETGIHRGQNFTTATGDIIVIEAGAILNGTENVGTTGWTDEGGGIYSKSVVSGERQSAGIVQEEPGFNPNNLEALVIDGLYVAWVTSSGAIDGRYTAYYDGSTAYIGVNPATVSTIEVSRGEYIDGGADDFGGETQGERARVYGYTVDTGGTGEGLFKFSGASLVHDVEIYSCSGCGISQGDGSRLRNVTVHDCGQMGTSFGWGGYGGPIVEEGCIFTNNAIGGWNNGWEGGNVKWADTIDLVVKGSWWDMGDHPYGNHLAPMWLDINNDGWLIYSNLFTDLTNHLSRRGAVFLEISHSGKMFNNVAVECGWDASNTYWSHGLLCIDASGVDQDGNDGPHPYTYPTLEFYGNLAYRCNGGLSGVMNRVPWPEGDWDEGPEPGGHQLYGYWESCGWRFHDNTVYIDGTEGGLGNGDSGVWFGGAVDPLGEPTDLEWEDNVYIMPNDETRWHDNQVGGAGDNLSWAAWQADGMDTGSRAAHLVASGYDPYPLNGGAM